MDINQLSANIDTKLVQLDQQLSQLKLQLTKIEGGEDQEQGGEDQELRKTITTLEQVKHKLIKSRDIAWRAHELQSSNDHTQLKRNRMIGLGLCIFSGLGLIAIVLTVLLR
jgi:AICAR transformylase/IMP cyclohydrolase PurH